jgi:hypothetical protein
MNARESLHFLRGVNFSNKSEMFGGIFCEGGLEGSVRGDTVVMGGGGVGGWGVHRASYRDVYNRTDRITAHFTGSYLYFSFYGVVFELLIYGVVFVLFILWGSYLFFSFYGVVFVPLILGDH